MRLQKKKIETEKACRKIPSQQNLYEKTTLRQNQLIFENQLFIEIIVKNYQKIMKTYQEDSEYDYIVYTKKNYPI